MIKNIIKAEMKKKKAPKSDVDKVIDTLDKLDLKTLNTLFSSPSTVAQFMKDPSMLEQYVKEDAKPQTEDTIVLDENVVEKTGENENN